MSVGRRCRCVCLERHVTDHSFAEKFGCSLKHFSMTYCNTNTQYQEHFIKMPSKFSMAIIWQFISCKTVRNKDISDFHFLKKMWQLLGMKKKKASKEQIELERFWVIFFFECYSEETKSVPEVITTAYKLWGDETELFLTVVYCSNSPLTSVLYCFLLHTLISPLNILHIIHSYSSLSKLLLLCVDYTHLCVLLSTV